MLRPKVLFLHGWSYGPALWHTMINHLPSSWVCETAVSWEESIILSGEYDVIIGHSFGFLAAYQALRGCVAPPKLIAMNSAPQFVSSSLEGGGGIPDRVLGAMIRAFRRDPKMVIADFQTKAGASFPCSTPMKTLEEALIVMQNAREIPTPPPVMLALCSHHDPILSYPWQGKADEHRVHPTAGHVLPLQDPAWCADALMGALS